MSKMSTTAVLKCKYCGKPVLVTDLSTSHPDPNAEQLGEFMQNLSKIAMCDNCRARYNYMAAQGRAGEFLSGAQSPIIINTKGK